MKTFEVFGIIFYALLLGLFSTFMLSSIFNVKDTTTLINVFSSSATCLIGFYSGFKVKKCS